MSAREPDGGLAAALIQLAEQGKEIRELRQLVETVAANVADQSESGRDGDAYQPVPARWWRLEGEERRAAIERLAGWVKVVYRPSYGHLAARLPACWPEHPLCLFMLDWLSELHAVLYLQPRRTAPMLSGQAEWHSRLLPAAAEAMARDAVACPHRRSRI